MTREMKLKDNGVLFDLKAEAPWDGILTPEVKSARRDKGLTLMEIMVVVGLLTFIMSAIFGILASARRTWATTEALITLQQEGRLGLDRMVRELRLSSFATVGADNKTVRFNIPIDADRDGFIDLTPTKSVSYGIDDPDDSINPNGLYGEIGWEIEYEIDTNNKQVIRRILDTADNPVTERILAKNINVDPAHTYFCVPKLDQTCGTGSTIEAVNIGLAIQIDRMEGLTLSPPLEIALRTRVDLRN